MAVTFGVTLCIYIVTWSVNTFFPGELSIIDLLSLDGRSKCPNNTAPDLYVISLQQLSDYPFHKINEFFNENPWITLFNHELLPLNYVQIDTNRMWGMLITMYCIRKHAAGIQKVMKDVTKSETYGTKGGMGLSIRLYGRNVVLVSVNMSKDQTKRSLEYHKILSFMEFDNPKCSHILDHDYIFFFGNFDSQVKIHHNTKELFDSIIQTPANIPRLLKNDDLVVLRKTKQAFSTFLEQKINFLPTFKFYPSNLLCIC